jgi:hypothetical protein
MDSNGGYSDDEWATIYGAGGASPVPSYLSSHYPPRRFRSFPSAAGTWMLAVGAFFVLAIPLAVRAGVKGNRLAWAAVVVAATFAVAGQLVRS